MPLPLSSLESCKTNFSSILVACVIQDSFRLSLSMSASKSSPAFLETLILGVIGRLLCDLAGIIVEVDSIVSWLRLPLLGLLRWLRRLLGRSLSVIEVTNNPGRSSCFSDEGFDSMDVFREVSEEEDCERSEMDEPGMLKLRWDRYIIHLSQRWWTLLRSALLGLRLVLVWFRRWT